MSHYYLDRVFKMDAVIQWVSQIIIFLLLTTIIDQLIPTTAMKKYIKLVLGLILILIFLKPVFYLFTIDLEQGIERSFNQYFTSQEETNRIENETNMQEKEIQATHDAYISEQMKDQLIEIAADRLAKEFQLEITDVQFIFYTEEIRRYEDLEELAVHLRELDEAEGVVDIVEEITIPINEAQENMDKYDDQAILKLLTEVWELEDKKVTISWERGRN